MDIATHLETPFGNLTCHLWKRDEGFDVVIVGLAKVNGVEYNTRYGLTSHDNGQTWKERNSNELTFSRYDKKDAPYNFKARQKFSLAVSEAWVKTCQPAWLFHASEEKRLSDINTLATEIHNLEETIKVKREELKALHRKGHAAAE